MDEYDKNLEQDLMEIAFGEISSTSRGIFERLGREYCNGEFLFEEGDEGTDLFLILSGEVVVTKKLPNGSRIQLACLGSGEILGEMSHFDDLPRSAAASARGTTRVLVFSRENFALIFQLHPKWTIQLVAGLAGRIRRSLENLPSI